MLTYDIQVVQEKFEEICEKLDNGEVDCVIITIEGEPKLKMIKYNDNK